MSEYLGSTSEALEAAEASSDEASRARAIERLRTALDRASPREMHPDDVRVVRQDVCFALADLLLVDQPRAALETARQCLAEGRGEDVFTANLLAVEGRALEAVGEELEATRAYYEALKINDALLRRTLSTDPPPNRTGAE